MAGKKGAANCETCENYIFDEEMQVYTCDRNLDEDEMYRFMAGSYFDCPYYRFYDEYMMVRKQN